MKYRKWDSKTKAKIVLESLQNKIPLAELCNQHQMTQSQYTAPLLLSSKFCIILIRAVSTKFFSHYF